MQINRQPETDLFAIKFESEDKGLVDRAANAVVVKRCEDAKAKELVAEALKEFRTNVLALGAVTKRIQSNRPPLSMTSVEGGLAISVGEEGFGTYDRTEVEIVRDFLQEYSDATVNAIPDYRVGGGLRTSAWERANYGFEAQLMAGALRDALSSQE